MRGRTNVSNGSVNINANVGSYEVYKNQNIVAGNMVDFITEKKTGNINIVGITNVLSYEIRKFIFKLSDGRYICFFSKSTYYYYSVLKEEDSQLSIEIPYTELPFDFYEIIEMNQNNFLIFSELYSSSSSSNSKYDIVCNYLSFNVETNVTETKKINISTQLSTYSRRLIDFKVKKYNDEIYIFVTTSLSSSSSVTYIKCNCTGNNISDFSITKELEISEVAYMASANMCFTDFIIVNDSIYCFYGTKADGVNYNQFQRYFRYVFMIDGKTVSGKYDAIGNSIIALNTYIISNGSVFKIFYRDTSNNICTVTLDCTNCTASSFNPVKYNTINLNPFFDKSGYLSYMSMFKLTDNKFLFALGQYSGGVDTIYVSEINNDNTIVYEGKKIEDKVEAPAIFSIDEKNFLYLELYGGYLNLTHFLIEDNLIAGGDNQDKAYVKNSESLQYIRGIAKDSGTAGQIIDVYVPKV